MWKNATFYQLVVDERVNGVLRQAEQTRASQTMDAPPTVQRLRRQVTLILQSLLALVATRVH